MIGTPFLFCLTDSLARLFALLFVHSLCVILFSQGSNPCKVTFARQYGVRKNFSSLWIDTDSVSASALALVEARDCHSLSTTYCWCLAASFSQGLFLGREWLFEKRCIPPLLYFFRIRRDSLFLLFFPPMFLFTDQGGEMSSPLVSISYFGGYDDYARRTSSSKQFECKWQSSSHLQGSAKHRFKCGVVPSTVFGWQSSETARKKPLKQLLKYCPISNLS